jgi:hypothetical protein
MEEHMTVREFQGIDINRNNFFNSLEKCITFFKSYFGGKNCATNFPICKSSLVTNFSLISPIGPDSTKFVLNSDFVEELVISGR